MPSDLSRQAALSALEHCRRSGSFSSASIDAAIKEYQLDGRSAALASKISLGVLQNMTLCDFYIDHYCSAPSKLEPKVRDILRISVFQLVFMDRIPASAAVNEAVGLCKKLGYARASGLVNAVLRKLSSSLAQLPEIEGQGSAEYLSVRYSHPLWLVRELINEHGYEFTEAFLSSNNSEVQTALQVNTLKTSASELLRELTASRADAALHPWLPDCILVSGNPTRLKGFSEGLFYVQDPAAKCAVLAAGLTPSMSVLDACAAPGGKSFAAAIAMRGDGSILSCDLHEKKLRLISEGAERLGIDIIKTSAADARTPTAAKYDAVIADVPCSGYGVIRKKPEIRYKPEAERAALPGIQAGILDNLADSVKPGGVLMYSTCTVFKQENEDIVSGFLSRHSDFYPEDFVLPNSAASKGGMLTLWPHIHGTDGFFMAKLRKK